MSDIPKYNGTAFIDPVPELKYKIKSLTEQVKLLEEGLEFYADIENWSYVNQNCKISMKIDQEYNVNYTSTVAGKRARAALEQLKKMRGET